MDLPDNDNFSVTCSTSSTDSKKINKNSSEDQDTTSLERKTNSDIAPSNVAGDAESSGDIPAVIFENFAIKDEQNQIPDLEDPANWFKTLVPAESSVKGPTVGEIMKNVVGDEEEDLMDYYANQLGLPEYYYEEEESEDTKDLEIEIPFPKDPFTPNLVICLNKLKEYKCSICDKILYTEEYYKKHLNSRSHRSAAKAKKQPKIPRENKEIDVDMSRDNAHSKKITVKSKKSKNSSHKTTANETKERKMRKCTFCEECFLKSEDLKIHCNEKHEGKMPFPCKKCPEGFVMTSLLKRHNKRVHSTKKSKKESVDGDKDPNVRYASKICNKTFSSERKCKKHEENHQKFSCEVCNKCFKSTRNLKIHQPVHSSEKPFICLYCADTFTRKQQMELHVEAEHLGKTVTCNFCGKEFLRKKNLVVHVKNRHPAEVQQVKCLKCPKIFPSEQKQEEHMYKVHNDNKVHPCTVCGKMFKERYALIVHLRIHSGEKPHNCEICNETFSSSSNLCTHRLHMHDDGKDKKQKQICELCGRELSGYSVAHHKKVCSGERPYKCHLCPAEFHNAWKRKRHIESDHHRKKHGCEFCTKQFKRIEDLVIHRRRHTGETPYKCEQCPSAFPSASKKRHHVQTVHLKECHLCSECDKEFSTTAALNAHKKTHAVDYDKNKRCRFPCSRCSHKCRSQQALAAHQELHDSLRPFPCDQCNCFFNHRSNLAKHKKKLHQK